jgi:hypothetical protein
VGTGIGDGNTAPQFDGTNDYISLTTAALLANLDGNEGTLLAWRKVANAGVWTDGSNRYTVYIADDSDFSDSLQFRKTNVNNEIQFQRDPPFKQVFGNGGAPTGWEFVGITWSDTADELKAWQNAVQFGATQNGLNAAAYGAIRAVVGGNSDVAAASPWHGQISHVMLFGRVLPQATIANLYAV